VDAGELSPRTFAEYKEMPAELVAHSRKARPGSYLDPEDFASLRNKLAKKWRPHRLKKAIQYIRCNFKHAYESGLIEPVPVEVEVKVAPASSALAVEVVKVEDNTTVREPDRRNGNQPDAVRQSELEQGSARRSYLKGIMRSQTDDSLSSVWKMKSEPYARTKSTPTPKRMNRTSPMRLNLWRMAISLRASRDR
jgi:hypothetical protein